MANLKLFHSPQVPDVGSILRNILTVAAFAALAGVGFVGARHWQSQQAIYERVAKPGDCLLQNGACTQPLAAGAVSLSILPQSIPLMTTLTLDVDLGGQSAQQVAVDIRGLNMDMGLNRTVLQMSENGRWRGETILPVCSQRRMEWEAAVQIDGEERFEVPFLFSTVRP